MIKNILQSLFKLIIGAGPFGALSVFFIILMITGVGPDHKISSYIGDNIINSDGLAETGESFEDISDYMFRFLRDLNISLLSLTVVMCTIWTIASHYLNINAPGKAKLYFIHWIIFSGVFVGLNVAINFYFTETTSYFAQQFLSSGGKFIIFIANLAFYTLMYYVGVLLGTARYARSSVLLANKLPGGF